MNLIRAQCIISPFNRCMNNKTVLMWYKHVRAYVTCTIKEIMLGEIARKRERITIKGWVRLCRSQKNVIFLNVSDGSCASKLQVVLPASACTKPPTIGSSVEACGELVESSHKGQLYELQADTITVLGDMLDSNFPFVPGRRYSLEYLRKFPHLRARTNVFQALLRIRSQACMQLHKYFQDYYYTFIHSPIITSSDCEGAGDLFTVTPKNKENTDRTDDQRINDFFNSPSFLTVSGQLHAEALMSSLSHVYTFGPAFRAEKSHTRHHLAEFYMIEAESTRFDNMEILISSTEHFVKETIKKLLVICQDDLSLFDGFVPPNHKIALDDFLNFSCTRMTYKDAISALEATSKKFTTYPKWGEELQSDHENYLIQMSGNKGLFITDFPAKLRPFYCRKNDDDKTVAAFDFLVPTIGELIGGSLREERFDLLLNNMKTFNISQESYSWYIDLRRYGTIRHGGFGMGFERFLQFILGLANIRDVMPFPRYSGSCKL
ncbi:putative asparagine--tRNA ligase, mitochondrial [Trichoplax sp. H2]|uniref:asparagine--tRNA ligase n=1 Tax=Trichoplax adhaerens TaxID=10228 RepID=B3RN59_TRIAD|nr:hypothetical protein TRIADDRAFT_53048 [Trichoplax adhaerens]EDV27398.1 hypothetical protein TRIADDRAFT_53048 [Trichoplax adhaerens]RDD43859.1 putative asparagine--tRNA ligase, mitochondrial [Trichoplax sp. H2]|eukprot:XP_002109232.1 hypothetical protein TRIADDRAFT_53048 [Trichoplax adhaerens]